MIKGAVSHSRWAIEELCFIGRRVSVKRKFVVASRVIGRYCPTPVQVMRDVAAELANGIKPLVRDRVLLLGVSEAGLALSFFVRDELVRKGLGCERVCSTRARPQAGDCVQFSEPHSHLPNHYVSFNSKCREARYSAGLTLVIVDDEVTTGTTMRNATAAMSGFGIRFENVVQAAISSWGGAHQLAMTENLSPGCHRVVLASGHIVDSGEQQEEAGPDRLKLSVGAGSRDSNLQDEGGEGVYGTNASLVVGIGEDLEYALLVASDAADRRGNVWFQSTTTAPVAMGGEFVSAGAHTVGGRDGEEYFLYNCEVSQFAEVNWAVRALRGAVPEGVDELGRFRVV